MKYMRKLYKLRQKILIFFFNYTSLFTKSCQDAPLLAVGRNGILVRGFGGQIPPTYQTASLRKPPPLAAGIFTVDALRQTGGGTGKPQMAKIPAVQGPEQASRGRRS